MDKELKQRATEIIKSIMGIDISLMSEETRFNTISEWDSFNNLMLISKLQEELCVEFTAVEIEATKNIKDLFNLIWKKCHEIK
ncbi:MAG: acyl carrier protein [Nanoarchaeota archaeon]|nr:acyl carrier protein [Nanoarchaeota archaeon]